MKITFSPQRRDDALTLTRSGDVMTINGAHLDLSALPIGATLPREAIDCPWIAGPIDRDADGVLHIRLVLPHGPDAPYHVKFPEPIVVSDDGDVLLPTDMPAIIPPHSEPETEE